MISVSLGVIAVILTPIIKNVWPKIKNPNVTVKVEESKINEEVSGISIEAVNHDIRKVRINNIGVLVPNKERLLQGNRQWVLTEESPQSEIFYVNDKKGKLIDIYEYIQSGKYVAYVETYEGKRYYSCQSWIKRCQKLKS